MSERPSIAAPCRVLIVEDDWLISEVLADQVSEMNLQVVGVAATVAEALGFLATEDIDAVLLDMKLHERFAGDVAAELQRQGVPFLFVTGYAKALDPRYDDVPILRKPFDMIELQAALADILPARCLPEPENLAPSSAA
jgi:DNA-binding response OmpR family regulator